VKTLNKRVKSFATAHRGRHKAAAIYAKRQAYHPSHSELSLSTFDDLLKRGLTK